MALNDLAKLVRGQAVGDGQIVVVAACVLGVDFLLVAVLGKQGFLGVLCHGE